MRGRTGGLVVCLAVASLAGCLLFTDLGGYAGSLDEPGDASLPDRSLSEASNVTDAKGDALDAGRPFSCDDVTGVELCADFDHGSVDLFWDELKATNGGDAAADPIVFLSPPRSFRAAKVATTANNSYARLQKAFTRTYTRMRIDFDMRIDRLEETGQVMAVLNVNRAPQSGNYYSLSLYLSKSGAQMHEDIPRDGGIIDYRLHTLSFPSLPRLGVWTHVLFELRVPQGTPASSSLRLKFDDVDKLAPDGGIAISAHEISGRTDVSLGLYYIYPSAAWEAWFDNVVVRME